MFLSFKHHNRWNLNITLAPNEKKGGARGKDPLQDTVEAIIQASDLFDFKPRRNNSLGLTIELGWIEFHPVWIDSLFKVQCWMTML